METILPRPGLSLVIPVHNNESTLEELFAQSIQKIHCFEPLEFIFIDDASNDSSREILGKLQFSCLNIRIVKLPKNIGQWEATLLGISYARHEYISTIDADLQYAPQDLPILYEQLIEHHLLLVYGIPSRMLNGAGGIRNRLQNHLLNKSYTSSFKIFHRSIVFNRQNRFLPDRHFEAFEKFNVPQERKGWLSVNTNVLHTSGFRRHPLRNLLILLTYLPEYNYHLRHPFIPIGFFTCIFFGLLFIACSQLGLSPALSGICSLAGLLVHIIGQIMQQKYHDVATYRNNLFKEKEKI